MFMEKIRKPIYRNSTKSIGWFKVLKLMKFVGFQEVNHTKFHGMMQFSQDTMYYVNSGTFEVVGDKNVCLAKINFVKPPFYIRTPAYKI